MPLVGIVWLFDAGSNTVVIKHTSRVEIVSYSSEVLYVRKPVPRVSQTGLNLDVEKQMQPQSQGYSQCACYLRRLK